MDLNYYQKEHDKIKAQFRHDIIMRKIKEREDRLFKAMFIKVILIIIIAALLLYIISKL